MTGSGSPPTILRMRCRARACRKYWSRAWLTSCRHQRVSDFDFFAGGECRSRWKEVPVGIGFELYFINIYQVNIKYFVIGWRLFPKKVVTITKKIRFGQNACLSVIILTGAEFEISWRCTTWTGCRKQWFTAGIQIQIQAKMQICLGCVTLGLRCALLSNDAYRTTLNCNNAI